MEDHSSIVSVAQAVVATAAGRVREAGGTASAEAVELVRALEDASAAASGWAGVGPAPLLSGPALAECAALLARRARDLAAEIDRIAEDMVGSAGYLGAVDREVAGRVTGAAS
ncbi:hypothetical protein [Dietzia sp. NCCP-2495]|uniref:hypothetical protein n=1 Tax=Dietzia sp. NCCP-2495 TaxID=2934675 RepID=UPI002232081C|nr:hypothetical protein [Dietzia sp. NCCP-2495]